MPEPREMTVAGGTPRVGDTHRRRRCAQCGRTTVCTYMRGRSFMTPPYVELWLCRLCTQVRQQQGRLLNA